MGQGDFHVVGGKEGRVVKGGDCIGGRKVSPETHQGSGSGVGEIKIFKVGAQSCKTARKKKIIDVVVGRKKEGNLL